MLTDNFAVPELHGDVIIEPAFDQLLDTVTANHRLLSEYDFDLAGRPFQPVLKAARKALTRLAAEYTASLGVEPVVGDSGIVVACGHQPSFAHPGVWIKNHLIASIAQRLGGTSINTVINSDHTEHVAFQTVRKDSEFLERQPVFLIPPQHLTTFEDVNVADADRVEAFRDEVLGSLTGKLKGHRFDAFAEHMRGCFEWSPNAADLLTGARRRAEADEGLTNLELPISRACDTDPFRLLFLHILRDAPRFVEVYNKALHDYRAVNNVRSPANPLPDLAVAPDLWEMPFWLSPPGEPRRPCCVRIHGDRYAIFSGDTEVCAVERRDIDDGETAVGALRRVADAGWRFRLKAVTNSIFSRLLLADIFVHGVGGAKYDLVTDQVFADFFRVSVPAGALASATVHLPIDGHDAENIDPGAIKGRIHKMRSNPASVAGELLPDDPEVAGLIAEKRKLVDVMRGAARRAKRRAFGRSKELDALLAPKLEPFVREQQRMLEQAQLAARQRDVVEARDYPFCLFPAGMLSEIYGLAAD